MYAIKYTEGYRSAICDDRVPQNEKPDLKMFGILCFFCMHILQKNLSIVRIFQEFPYWSPQIGHMFCTLSTYCICLKLSYYTKPEFIL